MKESVRKIKTGVQLIVCQLTLIICLIASVGSAAESSDLKTFETEESYVVEGVSIVFTQKVGEASVKLTAAQPAQEDSSGLTAANGARFRRERKLQGGMAVYALQSVDAVSEAASKTALASLNENSDIEYAYPVYANPATGFFVQAANRESASGRNQHPRPAAERAEEFQSIRGL